MSDLDDRVIQQFRADGGQVDGSGGGLVLLHGVGAQSGAPRVHPVMALTEGGSWLVVASAAGARSHPARYFDLVAEPDLAIETPQGSVDVHAVDLDADERRAASDRFVAVSPGFAGSERQATPRRIPSCASSPAADRRPVRVGLDQPRRSPPQVRIRSSRPLSGRRPLLAARRSYAGRRSGGAGR